MKKEELKEMIISVADQSNVTRNNLVYVEIENDEKEAETHWNAMLLCSEYKRGNKKALTFLKQIATIICGKYIGFFLMEG